MEHYSATKGFNSSKHAGKWGGILVHGRRRQRPGAYRTSQPGEGNQSTRALANESLVASGRGGCEGVGGGGVNPPGAGKIPLAEESPHELVPAAPARYRDILRVIPYPLLPTRYHSRMTPFEPAGSWGRKSSPQGSRLIPSLSPHAPRPLQRPKVLVVASGEPPHPGDASTRSPSRGRLPGSVAPVLPRQSDAGPASRSHALLVVVVVVAELWLLVSVPSELGSAPRDGAGGEGAASGSRKEVAVRGIPKPSDRSLYGVR